MRLAGLLLLALLCSPSVQAAVDVQAYLDAVKARDSKDRAVAEQANLLSTCRQSIDGPHDDFHE